MLAVLIFLLTTVSAHVGHHHGFERAHESDSSGLLTRYMFPYSARYNALLATFYISIAPCIIVAAIPAFRKPQKSRILSLMVAFSFGTLMGDILLHLLPAIFAADSDTSQNLKWYGAVAELLDLGASNVQISELLSTISPDGSKSLSAGKSPLRTVLLGFLVFSGFLIFMIIDKGFKLANYGAVQNSDNAHYHIGHSHTHVLPVPEDSSDVELASIPSVSSEVSENQEITHRSSKKDAGEKTSSKISTNSESKEMGSLQTSAYLSLVSAFVHNITDGFALASSFYVSRSTGVVTTIAVLVHEIPHELGDFAILLASGIDFGKALRLQAIGAIGSLLGTLCGCLANEMTITESTYIMRNGQEHWQFSISEGMLPITAGGLLFISTIGIVPELLRATAKTKDQELANSMLQLASILAGFLLMAWMSLSE
ncbi:LANO_0F10660g1_1 [Lachancea nothofagi CBS 11611]|uniref:LANO_0F10660g1_1 n=1 Tax=Lachancea nothofagi CBS 11611 TaxID=1266666 RepID=A0A1G4KAN1_9SACH|nr:LANO_0F10660g1_1 [Lachancea nothofagi CBS 11611]